MNLRNLGLTLKSSVGNFLRITSGEMRGHSYIPHPRTIIAIEPITYCNLECTFCTYKLGRRSQAVMAQNLFQDYVDQSVDLGFDAVALTPINGDAFLDKGLDAKLAYLEEHPGVKAIVLYSNFIAASESMISTLLASKKLSLFNISVYGCDEAEFARITGRGAAQFQRLLKNLERLLRGLAQAGTPSAFQFSLRTSRRFRLETAPKTPLTDILLRLKRQGAMVEIQSRCDDWGGLIKEADMEGLEMDLICGELLYKKGACILPFYQIQILADGRVNACACRDIDGELCIGDLRLQSLRDVISSRNPAYTSLIARQQAGDFPQACKGCSFYRSIYDSSIKGASPKGHMTLDEFSEFQKTV